MLVGVIYIESPYGDSVKYRAIVLSNEWYDKSPMGRSLARLQYRNTQAYSLDAQQNPQTRAKIIIILIRNTSFIGQYQNIFHQIITA